MPETRGEWALFFLGLAAIGVLTAGVLVMHSRSETATSPLLTTTIGARGAVFTTTEAATTATSATFALRLTARDDTWLAVRRTGPTGTVIYEGTLSAGKALRFRGTAFSVRFGAASNVAASVDGRALALPGGTYTVSITRAGLGSRTAG